MAYLSLGFFEDRSQRWLTVISAFRSPGWMFFVTKSGSLGVFSSSVINYPTFLYLLGPTPSSKERHGGRKLSLHGLSCMVSIGIWLG